mmetsp:Transcript_27097/g.80359  ORF Transcript_27097/g.80359 Transcript_27097/m.80359 type:complete len:214 (+) Transcript_27097:319-960(+)
MEGQAPVHPVALRRLHRPAARQAPRSVPRLRRHADAHRAEPGGRNAFRRDEGRHPEARTPLPNCHNQRARAGEGRKLCAAPGAVLRWQPWDGHCRAAGPLTHGACPQGVVVPARSALPPDDRRRLQRAVLAIVSHPGCVGRAQHVLCVGALPQLRGGSVDRGGDGGGGDAGGAVVRLVHHAWAQGDGDTAKGQLAQGHGAQPPAGGAGPQEPA